MDPNVDLLGNSELPVREPGRGLFASLLRLIVFAALAAGAYYAFVVARDRLRDFNEENQKRAVRRKYGIPDDSKEPFNVAYAKAEKKKREDRLRQAQYQTPSRMQDPVPQSSGYQRISRQSTPQQRAAPTSTILGGRMTLERSPLSRTWYPEGQGNQFGAATDDGSDQSSAHVSASNHLAEDDDARTLSNGNAHHNERDSYPEEYDTSAMDMSIDSIGGEFGSRTQQSPRNARGAKRGAAPVDEIENNGTFGRKAGKRTRRQSRKLPSVYDENEGGDRLMELDPVSRGKKRDRAEAASTFGGDDESPLSGQGRRKTRRQKRKSDMSDFLDESFLSRGTKRNFEAESTLDSEDGASPRHAKMSRGLGRNSSESSDMSLDGPVVEATCGNRRIGEEWHANGVTFKVGQDGRRQRQVLLRRRRSRFSMPQDSEHPDSHAQLEVLVETWLNDNEFAAAEERGDVYNPSSNTIAVVDLNSAAKAGKQLLWGTPSKAALTPKSMNSMLISSPSSGNPFERPSSGNGRRISLISDSRTSPLASPSMSIRHSKSYSKWEKQDLEAEAMAKLRQKLEEEKKSGPTVVKKVAFELPPSSTTSAAPSGASTPSVNGADLTPAPSRDETPASSKPAGFTFPGGIKLGTPTAAPPAAGSSSTPSQPKVPTFALTPPQPSKDQPAPQMAKPSLFGAPTAVTAEKKHEASTAAANRPSFPLSSVSFPSANAGGAKKVEITAAKPIAQQAFGFGVSKAPEASIEGNPATSSSGASGTSKPLFSFGIKPSASEPPKVPSSSPVAFGATPAMSKPGNGPFASAAMQHPSSMADSAPKLAEPPKETTNKPVFSFNTAKAASPQPASKPASPAPSPSPFGAPAASQPSLPAATFSLGGPNSSRPSGATEAPKTSPFGSTSAVSPFGMPQSAAAPSSTSLTTPSFKFGAPSAPSTTASSTSRQAKPLPFGMAASTSSPFGSHTTPVFGSTASPFSAAASAPKSPFSFGSTASNSPVPAQPENKTENKPSFSFNFGGSSSGSAPGSSTNATSTPSPFGAVAGNSGNATFSFGSGSNPSPSSGTTASPFGAANGSAQFTFGK